MNLYEVISSSLDANKHTGSLIIDDTFFYTGSVINVTSSLETSGSSSSSHYHPPLTAEDLLPLSIGLNDVKEQIRRIYLLKAMEYLQLPSDLVEPYVNKIVKEKTPRLGRPLMEGEIKDAISKTKTMSAAANYLGVGIKTLHKYCMIYHNQAKINDPQSVSLWQPTRGWKAISKKIPAAD